MKKRIAKVIAPISLILLIAAACGDDDDDSPADAASTLCGEMQDLNSTVDQITGDPNSTTVGDVESDLDDLQSQVEDVENAGSDLSSAVKSSLKSAFDDFQSSVQNIPSDDTLAQAGSSVENAGKQFQKAWSDTLGDLNCSSN